ncbi:phospholipase [Duganella sp. BJB488]|uniref:phospholipase D-like domain-containing protein n=1 Tax=unclassified Duganella TaxID=2636909 RepID=UPI000E341F1F|nr:MULTISPECIES: phospholipase D-like domain-containing protein [unclassified Duganella]RFP25808.1 phospholipase [Duganella sp. BJB489]RFP28451.1 phospholipase [Duganella sp. BJB488]RFP36739.1 phospholipase [Duganella sp. BJB480]
MAANLQVVTNSDDALLAWTPDPWSDDLVGFRLERKDLKTGNVTVLNNRIPAGADGTQVPVGGVASTASPIRRCMWVDHDVEQAGQAAYRVTPMAAGAGGFVVREAEASPWVSAEAPDSVDEGAAVYFNRGTIMSQVVSRLAGGEVNVKSLKALKAHLAEPGYPGRRYLAGQARHALLDFMANADRRGNHIYAALYELNDPELIAGLKAFGARCHLLLGNGSSTFDDTAHELESADVIVKHRDLSHTGASSPSVHNKFVVEVDTASGQALRMLTGSTNWTTTGLCTQLNNVLVLERPGTANRFYQQWRKLAEVGDDMPEQLRIDNGKASVDGNITTLFAATKDQAEFAPVLDAIAKAKHGVLFLMFMPGQSPLLEALLARVAEADAPYIRGVVSAVTQSEKGVVTEHNAQVIANGVDPERFHNEVLKPDGLPPANLPKWALEEFQRGMYLSAGLNAIIHSKTLVIDPFSDDCVVVTGSHNFSPAASSRNDENLVIIRGDKALAQAYAVHIEGVYDHFAWRAFLSNGGDPATIYQPLTGWQGGNRAKELAFWMNRA